MSYIKCSGPSCIRPVTAKGLCQAHYTQSRKGKPLQPLRRKQAQTPKPEDACGMSGCTRKMVAYGLCSVHQHGDEELGEWRINPQGYVYRAMWEQLPGDEALQHREVMREALGRPLLAHENVHHKNGDRADNRLENLELWSTSQPAGQRIPDKVAHALEILARYAPEHLREPV